MKLREKIREKRTWYGLIVLILLSFMVIGCLSGRIDTEKRASFRVQGDKAIMTGVINQRLPARVRRLIKNHPEVRTIVLLDVPGSVDDEKNLEAARLIRDAGLATHVPANGEIASGGVDFFLAGSRRSIEKGAELGVHSWGGEDEEGKPIIASELPRNHREHKPYLDFYRDMKINSDFYWFTLEAAPVESIYWMTPEEIDKYGLVAE